ncbi:hypothetical protein B566_EDAN017245 [Ephemera danica]|nr:hypothetical protein B566_EDAN017245 [Ephemera danica]
MSRGLNYKTQTQNVWSDRDFLRVPQKNPWHFVIRVICTGKRDSVMKWVGGFVSARKMTLAAWRAVQNTLALQTYLRADCTVYRGTQMTPNWDQCLRHSGQSYLDTITAVPCR